MNGPRVLPLVAIIGATLSSCAYFPIPGTGDGPPVTSVSAEERNGIVSPSSEEALAKILRRVARKAEEAGDLITATRFLVRARGLEPSHPETARRLGALLSAQQLYDQAAAAYDDAVKLHPEDTETRLELARTLLRTDQPADAAKHLKIVRTERQTSDVFNLLGNALQLSGEVEEARQIYIAGLDLAPDDRALKNNLAVLLAQTGDVDTAANLLAAIPEGPIADKPHRRNLALVLLLKGDAQSAEAVTVDTAMRDYIRSPSPAFALIEGSGDAAYPVQVAAVARSFTPPAPEVAIAEVVLQPEQTGNVEPSVKETVSTTSNEPPRTVADARTSPEAASKPVERPGVASVRILLPAEKTIKKSEVSARISSDISKKTEKPQMAKAGVPTIKLPAVGQDEAWQIATGPIDPLQAGATESAQVIPPQPSENTTDSISESAGMATPGPGPTGSADASTTMEIASAVHFDRADEDRAAELATRLSEIEPAAGTAGAPAERGAADGAPASLLDRLMSFNVGSLVAAVSGNRPGTGGPAIGESQDPAADVNDVVPSPAQAPHPTASGPATAETDPAPPSLSIAATTSTSSTEAENRDRGVMVPGGESSPGFQIQLGAYRSAKAAQKGWYSTVKAAADVLGDLKLTIQRADLGPDKGVFYRLRVAGVADRDGALAICDRMKTRSLSCYVPAEATAQAGIIVPLGGAG